ncbi:SGNH/GDSL hydrolase family protein [Granulicella arctica]|uniref:SGNH/GDSL hydrolase family protein n=1 Tax=Granulicella arctica TaxID=940613 RepID=UPI0021E0A31E|nr:SGNH/GDSL hydrolase family protein [Granulicella arctica]
MLIQRSFRLCAAVVLLAFASVTAHAAKPFYDAIYVFGDSLCDVGNIYLATKGAEPISPPYYNGRFSNGPLWVEHVASSLGLPMTPALAGGTDYAFGGALVTAAKVTPSGTIPSVPQQVALYLSQHGGKADPKALYILEGGGNDILDATSGSPQSLGFQIAIGIAESELLLRQAGAKKFLISTLLDIGQTPAGQLDASFATAASVATNQSLDILLGAEQLIEGIHIRRMDFFGLLHAVAADATHFGFTNITVPCLNPFTNAVCLDPDHTLFWDAEHPTVFGHAFLAVTVENALPE